MPGFDSRHYPHCTQTDSAEAVGRWELYVGCDRGGYANNCVYEGVRGWYAFEPALTKAEEMYADAIWRCAAEIPEQWYERRQRRSASAGGGALQSLEHFEVDQ